MMFDAYDGQVLDVVMEYFSCYSTIHVRHMRFGPTLRILVMGNFPRPTLFAWGRVGDDEKGGVTIVNVCSHLK